MKKFCRKTHFYLAAQPGFCSFWWRIFGDTIDDVIFDILKVLLHHN